MRAASRRGLLSVSTGVDLKRPGKHARSGGVACWSPACKRHSGSASPPAGEVGIRRLNDEVMLIRHQVVRMTWPTEAITDIAKRIEEGLAIVIAEEDPLACVSAACSVVDCSFVFESQWASHERGLAEQTPRMET